MSSEKASLMMGLDIDGIFKVWAPNKYKDAITKEIENLLQQRSEKLAAVYSENVEVVGLKKHITLRRNAGISVLPGTKLYLANQKGATLTGFFVGDKGLYAISTSHLDDFTGEEAMYETGNGLEVLGNIVSHVNEGDPFREACLIKVKEDQYRNISEYISQDKPNYVTDIYQENLQDIPEVRKEGLMNQGPGEFAEVQCKTIASMRVEGELLRDVVVWTTKTDVGHEGQSGSAILWKSPSCVYEHQLGAMYIGKTELDDEVVLVSHAMHATISFFEGKIQEKLGNYNPNTKPAIAIRENVTNQVDTNASHPDKTPGTKFNVMLTSARNFLHKFNKNLTEKFRRRSCSFAENISYVHLMRRKQMNTHLSNFRKRVSSGPIIGRPFTCRLRCPHPKMNACKLVFFIEIIGHSCTHVSTN